MRLKVSDLKPGYYVFGNKGNVWSDTAHIYESGKGNMCGTPALSSNWAKIDEVENIGCPECLVKYKLANGYGDESHKEIVRMMKGLGLS